MPSGHERSPPPVPPHAPYTGYYCEENIYLLAESFLEIPDFRESWDLAVVFISNSAKTASVLFLLSLILSPFASDVAAVGAFFYSFPPADGRNAPRSTQVALWSQRAAREKGLPVIWDYHVVLVLRPLSSRQDDMGDGGNSHTGSWIYDFDTTLDLPYDAQRGYLIHRLSFFFFLLGQPVP